METEATSSFPPPPVVFENGGGGETIPEPDNSEQPCEKEPNSSSIANTVEEVKMALESERRQRRELELQLDAAKTEADKIQKDSDDSKDKMIRNLEAERRE